jgi:hypothetical protein
MRRCGEKAPAKKVHPGIAGKVAIKSVRSFLCLPKETNQRKGTRVTGPAEGGMPGVYAPHGVLLDAAGALQTRCAQTVQIPFSAASPVLGCVPMGIFPICPAAPRRRGRKKTRELFEGEARVFPRPALGEKQGKPAGPGLAGVPFSCFFFWARKRRKRKQQKGLATFPGIPG